MDKRTILELNIKKTTPGTVVYKEQLGDGEKPKVGSIYFKKGFVGSKPPKSLRVIVEVVKDDE